MHSGLRAILPDDISPLKLEEMPYPYHPTLDARGKEYLYAICNSPIQLPFYREFSWHVYKKLNLDHMREATMHLIGEKNFSAFSNMKYKDPVRHLMNIKIEKSENRIFILLRGNNFLYKMVRNIVGTLVYIGMGKISLEYLPEILASGKRELAGVTAPAHGLYLKKVFY